MMSIGSTIKRLRREKDITQEQLAEYLGITSRAISQWECDRTAPDISQIPALCHVFDVSSDVLLGIDIEKNNQKIQKYLDEAHNLCCQGRWEEYTAILREANKKFPRDYKIMHTLADAMVNEYSRKGIKEYDEVFTLCNRILSECTDSKIRYETMETLGIAYGYAGKKMKCCSWPKKCPAPIFHMKILWYIAGKELTVLRNVRNICIF
ncbi:MAG: helix-turn-helix transcriptional regulator [Clostridia bacterium]|nr:helix-turn-helix transcriptional regulator [Clostridia bacterium]